MRKAEKRLNDSREGEVLETDVVFVVYMPYSGDGPEDVNENLNMYVLGISSGASLGATIGIVSGIGTIFGGNIVEVWAFVGALVTSFLVMAIANVDGRANASKL